MLLELKCRTAGQGRSGVDADQGSLNSRSCQEAVVRSNNTPDVWRNFCKSTQSKNIEARNGIRAQMQNRWNTKAATAQIKDH